MLLHSQQLGDRLRSANKTVAAQPPWQLACEEGGCGARKEPELRVIGTDGGLSCCLPPWQQCLQPGVFFFPTAWPWLGWKWAYSG